MLAGPSVGQFFAELGCEVIKVENPYLNGDVTRGWPDKITEENRAHVLLHNITFFKCNCALSE